MGKIFTVANDEVQALVRRILEEQYPAIAGMIPELQIGVLFATSDKDGKPALAKGGYPCAGVIRIVSEEDRAAGGPDVIISLDGDRWDDWTDEERYSLIHHELHHLVPAKLRPRMDDSGGWFCEPDNLNRPKIRLRRHDFEIGGFNLIVEQHGAAALEWQAVERVHGAFNQQVFSFVTSKGKAAASKGA